jgi:hypothetical protein
MRRVASPASRSLRMAARLNGAVAALPATLNSYVTTMARATRKPAAFSVNAFMPDGIIGTTMFDGVDVAGPATSPLDLSSIGLRGGRFTVGDVTRTIASAKAAQRELSSKGVPDLMIREGQHRGIFTDLHAERFGVLAANSPTVKSSDWLIVAGQVESLGERGIEGFLVESNTTTALMQVHSMRLDARSGQFTVDQVTARFSPERKSISLTEKGRAARGLAAAAAGTQIGKVSIGPAREFNAGGLFTALPPNALTTATGIPVQTFTLNPSYEFEHVGTPGRVPTIVSITIPPAIRDREVLNRFADATRGVQATWADAFKAKRVEVQVIDFPLAQVATVLKARTDPALTLPARLASTVSVAQLAVNKASAHVSAFLPKTKATLGPVFMIPLLFDRVMAWPHLRNAFYRDLADYDKNAFMPGVDNLPQDLIMLVQVNQYFIDAVMAGANFEMNRELLWRAFPTDLRGTPFQRFWGRKKYLFPMGELLLNDMEPMHQWRKQPLGERTDENMVDPNRIALLVRGQLLRRYPNTAVYAWKKRTTPPQNEDDITQLMKDANGHPLNADAIQTPVFSGFIPPDITFFGFDIDKEDVPQWCFVLEEQMSEPRFGFDVPVTPPGQPQGTAPKQRTALKWALDQLRDNPNGPLKGYNAYKALSWSHLGVTAGGFASVASLVTLASPPFSDFPTLHPDGTAADVATKLIQEPFRAYYLGADLAT